MNILLCTYWGVPHVGGVWHFMTQLKGRLEAMGHHVDVMGNSPDGGSIHMPGSGKSLDKSSVRPLLDAKLSGSVWPALQRAVVARHYEFDRYCFELAAACFGLEKYDVIHTQDIFSARAIARVKPPRTAHIAHLHGSVAVELMMHFGARPELGIVEGTPDWQYIQAIEHYGAMSGDVTVTANEWQKRLLTQRFGVPGHRITVFPYGLDIDSFRSRTAAGTALRPPAGKQVILFTGRLAHVKGVHVLLDALALLKSRRSDWIAWIAGDGEERQRLEAKTAELGMQQDVLFLGQRDDTAALLEQADLFVHACLQDNQPFSVMEAQIAGVPPIVSTAGGLPEMVEHGKTGLICPVNDALTLSGQLELLLAHDRYRRQLGANAKEWGERHWSLDRMVGRMTAVYEAVMAARSG